MYLVIFPDGQRAHFTNQNELFKSIRDYLKKKKDEWIDLKLYFSKSRNVNKAFQKLYGPK